MTQTHSLAAIEAFAAHDDPVNHIAFAEHGQIMATADTAMRVRIWRGRELIREFDMRNISDKVRPTERIRGIKFVSDGDRLIVAAGEHVASFKVNSITDKPDWFYIAPRLLAFLIISPTSIAISATDTLAASFDNGTIVTWDSNLVRRSIIRHNASPRYLQFLPDGSLIGTDGFSVSRWHPDERRPLWHRPSRKRLYGMAVGSNGKHVALRGLHSTTVHDIESGEAIIEHRQGRGLPLVAFCPGASCLAIGSQHAVNLHEVSNNTHARLALDEAELISLAFLPDGSQVLAGCSDGCVRVWENPLWERMPGNRGQRPGDSVQGAGGRVQGTAER